MFGVGIVYTLVGGFGYCVFLGDFITISFGVDLLLWVVLFYCVVYDFNGSCLLFWLDCVDFDWLLPFRVCWFAVGGLIYVYLVCDVVFVFALVFIWVWFLRPLVWICLLLFVFAWCFVLWFVIYRMLMLALIVMVLLFFISLVVLLVIGFGVMLFDLRDLVWTVRCLFNGWYLFAMFYFDFCCFDFVVFFGYLLWFDVGWFYCLIVMCIC